MRSYWNNIRSMDRYNWNYVIAWSVVSFASGGFSGVLFNLYLQQMGFDKAAIGQIIGIGSLIMALGSLPAGFLGARIGPHKAFCTGLLVAAIGWVPVLLAPLLPADWRTAVLFTGWGIFYLGYALFLVNGAPYFMQITTAENRIFLISFQQFIQGVVGAVGSLLAGVLPGVIIRLSGNTFSELFAFRDVLILVPILYVAAFLNMRLAPPAAAQPVKNKTAAETTPETLPAGLFAYFILIVFLWAVAYGGFYAFLNLFLRDLDYSVDQIGTLLSIVQVMPFLSAATVPLLNQRMKLNTLFGLGILLLAANTFLIALTHPLWVIITCLVFGGFGFAASNNVRPLYGQLLVGPRWRTYISSGNSIAMAVGVSLITTVGGRIIENNGFNVLFTISAAAATASGVIAIVYPRIQEAAARKALASSLKIQ